MNRETLEKILVAVLAIYLVGCGVSQSLMSLGGGLFAALGFFTALRLLRKSAPVHERRAALVTLLWVVFCIANLLVRVFDNRTGHTLGRIPLLFVPLAGFSLSFASSQKWKAPILKLTVLAVGASALEAASDFFMHGVPGVGLMRNPIYLAYNLLPAFVFFGEVLARRIHAEGFNSKWAALGASLALLGIFCSVSRVPLACALAYLLFRWAPELRRRRGNRALWLSSLAILLLGTATYQLSPRMQEKFNRSFSESDPSRIWRIKAWEHNWSLFLEHPLAGVGPEKNGIAPESAPEFQGHWSPGHLYFAHSIYLQSLADSGLVGTLLLIGIGVTLALAEPTTAPLLVTMAVAGLTENIFNNSRAAHALLCYLLLTIALARRQWRPVESA
ncbi:MAG: O-antigen ligase family protein [Bdellovibrionales bacterium]|nr:O-antigen ligase family protein [Bdellovibrionales bacterium]